MEGTLGTKCLITHLIQMGSVINTLPGRSIQICDGHMADIDITLQHATVAFT